MTQGPILPPAQDADHNLNKNYILYWNHAGLELNRLTHSEGVKGPQGGPPVSARALGLLHLAIHDAYFSIRPKKDKSFSTYLTSIELSELPALSANLENQTSSKTGAHDARQAVAGAAITVLQMLYLPDNPPTTTASILEHKIQSLIDEFGDLKRRSEAYKHGAGIGELILKKLDYVRGKHPRYVPQDGQYFFNDDPTNPVGQVYHEPYYGIDAASIATTKEHHIADPPPIRSAATDKDRAEYNDAHRDIHRMGGKNTLATTKRLPYQSTAAYFWAYDGANLIGTPPRLYNQILRVIAAGRKVGDDITSEANNEDFARLFALVNVAMADAGKFAWREKYEFEFWRPLSGVRQYHDRDLADPLWLSTGAPGTNSNRLSFKPPFPAYPSGHATFGAAAFQMIRRFYQAREPTFGDREPDRIGFEFVSEEMNGVSRELYQLYDPSQKITAQSGDVRTRVVKKFDSLWEAIFENAMSRVWLGVHWRFDACAAKDVLVSFEKGEKVEPGELFKTENNGATAYKAWDKIRYTTPGTRQDMKGEFPVGGVPLGLGIADDIFENGMKSAPSTSTPNGMKSDPPTSEPNAQKAEL